MKALLKTGETIEIIPNDDFCAAKYINKETAEYIFNDEIVEIINEESGKPMNQEGLEAEIQRVVENYNKLVNGSKVMKPSGIEKIARHFAQWGAERQKEQDLAEMAQSKSPLSVAYANRCFENGKQAMKEQMLKEAVESTVENGIYLSGMDCARKGYKLGDKVRIIICKKEDEK